MTTTASNPAEMEDGQPEPRGLAARYAASAPKLDEMLEPDGSLRPQWRSFVSMMDDLGHDQMIGLWGQARRIIRANGITHNVYGDPNGLGRPWNLDLLPLMLPAAEWASVGQGLIQRATLLNELLADLHGPATSIARGLLPPEIVYANPRFLRPAHGVIPPFKRWIHIYAADLVRNDAGQFQVLADRTQAPSGAGYSLENRIILTRVMPTIFRQCNVMRLAPFFIALRKTLLSLAPANRENPRVVLLTPGPYNETYFEHAYLARYLGYTLVQGNDLTVRDCRVYLKTLSGLRRVDVILRRVDDDFCDPLELYQRSYLGVAGLLQAVREGTVAVANAIGSGVIEAPAFLPFLPRLCKNLIGEELKVPSVPTWWCGDADSLKYVLDRLDTLVIKPAFPVPGVDPTYGHSLSSDELSKLREKIKANPATYVAQAEIVSTTAPILQGDKFVPRRVVVRSYLAASDKSYTVMPGGLTRVSSSNNQLLVSLQKGAGSKDTWIAGEKPAGDVTLLPPPGQPVELSRGGGDIPSRVADDMFWLGRYVQRAESVVRLARCIFNRLSDPNIVAGGGSMGILIRELLGWTPNFTGSPGSELAAELFAPSDPSGLWSSVRHLQGLARVLRDRISSDAWLILREIEREVSDFSSPIDDDRISEVVELLNKLVLAFLAFDGMAADSMTRGHPWRFLDMGSRLERAMATMRLIRSSLVTVSEQEQLLLEAMLEIADSSLTYRRRYLTVLEAPAVVDLLLADETNPRSIAYQVVALEEHLCSLPRDTTHPSKNPDHLLALKLRSMIRLTDLSVTCEVSGGRRPALDVFTRDVKSSLGEIADRLSDTYFNLARASDRLLGIDGGQMA